MNIWPVIGRALRKELHIGFTATRLFCMGVEVRSPNPYSEMVISISMWCRERDEDEYKMAWTYSVENEHLDCKELEI